MRSKKTIGPNLLEDSYKPKISWHYAWLFLIVIAFAASPWPALGGIVILAITFTIGCILFQEKMLLFFLLTRPTLDYWRDFVILRYEQLAINATTVIGILFCIWGGLMLIKHRRSLKEVPLWFLSLLTAVFFGATFFYSVLPLTSGVEALKFISVIIIFALGFIFVKKNLLSGKEILLTIFYSAIIPVMMALTQVLGGYGLTTFNVRGRIFGTLAHPNVFAFFILILVMAHIQYSYITPLFNWQGKEKLKHALTAFGSLLLMLTYTRASWIGLVIFLVITGLLYSKKIIYWLASAAIVGYIIIFPLNQWLWQKTDFNLESNPIVARLTGSNDDADSVEWRQAVARESWPLIQSRPWLGYGYGTFPLVWSDNRPISHLWDDSAEAHNDYLRILLETGSLGLAVYLGLLFSLVGVSVKNIKRDARQNIFLCGSLAVFIIISLSDNMLHHTPVMWALWVLWGATLANNHWSEKVKV